MKDYFFFNVFRKTIVQFFDAFNDIKIARYADDGKTVDRLIEVPIKHSIKEKVYYWFNDRKDDEMLPMITSYISSIDWAADRKVNEKFGFAATCDLEGSEYSEYLHPTPYNLTFTMNIWALHMVDIDQILEQILPFFSPHIFVRIAIEELNTAFDTKIVFRSATPEISHEMADLEYRVINYTLDFEVQTWFFKPTSDIGLINKIYGSYFPDAQAFTNYINNSTSTFSSGASGGESYELKGKVEDGELLVKYTLFQPS
jgi:glycosyltransferase involved in cell wall biosynthesis